MRSVMDDSRTPTAETSSLRVIGHAILGAISARRVVRFTLDGRVIQAFEGEPIAAAMLANGIRVSRTMAESGTPRGYFCGVGRCTDCLMVVNGVLNVRTCLTPVSDGMVVETQDGLGVWRTDS